MKLLTAAVFALVAAAPAYAAPQAFLVDFEKTWDYANGGVDSYYNGGAAADGSTGGANLGVSFVGVSGLSNDGLGSLPSGNYFENAPSMQGVAYAYDTAYMNVAGGVDSTLLFSYASTQAVTGAVKAYSGLNGTGTLLGSFNLAANSPTGYDTWTSATFNFAGTAQSFDLSATAYVAALDNISAVPEPTAIVMMMVGLASLGAARRRRG
jgi:hypothetical protein